MKTARDSFCKPLYLYLADQGTFTGLPWLSTEGGYYTDAATEELVAPPCACNLEAECLVKLALVLRTEE